jgi:uncharacterized membrane protein
VLAYVGASLPTLLILTSSDIGLGDGLNFEIVAQEIVAALAAVPLTTALTAFLAVRVRPEQLGPSDPDHVH